MTSPAIYVRAEIEPSPKDETTWWRKWDWRVCLATDDGRHAGTMHYGWTRTEAAATRKALTALADFIAMDIDDRQRRNRRRVVAVRPFEPLGGRP